MIEKHKPEISLYIILLVIFLAVSYFLSGLFLIQKLSLENLQDMIVYIFLHPLKNWWNEKSPACLGVGLLGWVCFVNWHSFHHRNFHFEQEYGSEEWADARTLKYIRNKDERKNRILSKHVSVSMEGVLSNNNMFIIGSSGSYKTNAVVTPNLLKAENHYIVLDVKGDLQYKFGHYLQEKGYTIRSLNLRDPEKSDRYNPFLYIEKEEDLIRLITNLHEAVRKPDAMQGDPFWDDGVDLYLQSVFYFEWLQSLEEKRNGNMNNILYLVNLEIQKMPDGETTRLQIEMEKLAKRKGDMYPPVRDYRKLKEGAAETVRSIIIMVNAMLKLCETAGLRRIFEGDDIRIRELGVGVGGTVEKPSNKKIALFLVLPDNDRSYNFLISMFYTQAFDILIRMADNQYHGPLPIQVEFWMDEFYAGAKPTDPDVLLGVVRSRNICMMPVLQSVSQIKTLFKNDKWETMLDNCATLLYLGSGPGALSTHKYISELLGKMTIDTRNDGRSSGRNGNASENYQKAGRELMTPAEVRRLDRGRCIIFLEGKRPIVDDKALPFHTKEYLHAMELNKQGGYEHPVYTYYDPDSLSYHTIQYKEKIHILDSKEAQYYSEVAKKDPTIRVFQTKGREFLYQDWNKSPTLSEKEIEEAFRSVMRGEENEVENAPPEDVTVMMEKETESTEKRSEQEEKWDLSGSVLECVKRHIDKLSEAELNQIIQGMEQGLTEWQIKAYFQFPAKKMEQYRRAYMMMNEVGK